MKNKSVLNTDSFDKRRFTEIFNMSKQLQGLNEAGEPRLPTFPDLLGDIWASLYKMKPEIKEEIPETLTANKRLMENIMADESFQNFREFTRLDDLSSALGTAKFGEKTNDWLAEQERKNEELRKQMEEARKLHQQLQQQQEKASGDGDDGAEGQRQDAEQNLQQAMKQAMEQIARELQQSGQSSFSQAMAEAVKETQKTKGDLKSLLGGITAGSGEAELKKVPLRGQIALAERISTLPELKEIAEWAGRFKQIARKKQRSKHEDSVDRSGITLGNQVERLLPMELGMYSHPATKADFLRRFAEGQTMQYEQKGKETLGKGPMVLCLDQSSSMRAMDTQAKGFAFALMSIARKQKRDFALILFSRRTRTFRYPKGKILPEEMVTLAETFLGGGTYFDRPLEEALKVVEESRFKKADVIFVTDGESYLNESFVERFNSTKQKKGFQVLSLLLGVEERETVELFSDEVLKAKDFDDESSHVAFGI
ncbi:VWA domain-containing protein [Kroppenstedtia guangzhouensis]|uniref:VWA domain-containing protein n=1 Tax=Kroppenstedtia guangzhouensis TaxID=1274356 RepID=A0ABQ1H1Z6_9BACL|nr:VWA domain-containing protein [Kroppenstedtia guangzhouensis]GGA56065.1 VWA domain-containing protein [Kroppenstedtia guangzhouensis]